MLEKETLRTRVSELESENAMLKEEMDKVVATKAESMPLFGGVVFEGQAVSGSLIRLPLVCGWSELMIRIWR